MDSTAIDVIRISYSPVTGISFQITLWLFIALLLIAIAIAGWKTLWHRRLSRFELVSLDIQLGNVGKVTLKPTTEDVHVAHRIWTELVTRKAALPIDINHDVITEVYDSWYALFGAVRKLIGSIPGHLVRKEASTRELVRITTDALNFGLRPHLTEWQAKYRNWYLQNRARLGQCSPQELQREFPEFDALVKSMTNVNQNMMQYARELQKIVLGE